MRRARILIAILAGAAACDGATADPGAGALLQVPDSQFVPGPPPEATGGPEVASLTSSRPRVTIGTTGERIGAALGPGSHAAILYLGGDIGHWIVPAEAPSVDTPDYPSIELQVGFSTEIEVGDIQLEARAVDADGRVGAPRVLELQAEEEPLPEGELVVSLAWDGRADLDLHVVDPDGIEVWAGNPNSYEPPEAGELPDPPGAWQTGGILDADSNTGCRLDGRRAEHVVWAADPPPGRYTVRVDVFSMCGDASAYWGAEAFHLGESLGRAEGVLLPADADLPHGRGSGVHAIDFDVPEPEQE